MARNGGFLADPMDRAWSFRQEMRRCKPRDIHDGYQSSAPASSGVRISPFRRRRICAQLDRLDFKLGFEGERTTAGPPRVGTAGANDLSRPTAF